MNFLRVGDRLINLDTVTRIELDQESSAVRVLFQVPSDRLILKGDEAQQIWTYVELSQLHLRRHHEDRSEAILY
jgi:hypothetical protein